VFRLGGHNMRKVVLALAGLTLLGGCSNHAANEPADTPRAASAAAGTTAPSVGPKPVADPQPESSVNRKQRQRADRDAEPRSATQQRDGRATVNTQARHHSSKLHRVIEVVDGDTVTVAYRGSEVSVRVIGIDTPETVHPTVPVECGGPQASATAKRLLTGKQVRLVFDRSQGRTDYYGRTLAYLETPGLGDFGLAMVRQGHAAEYTYDSAYARQSRYLTAQSQAQAHTRGVWNKCGGVDTPLHKPAPKPKPQTHTANNGGGGNCDPGYDPCIPPYPPDLDCSDVDGPIRVLGDDPHGFDADGDGIGCDS
jgi:micrococcal nuclease